MNDQSDTPSWWRCDTHGPGTRTAWGCPECVRELRTSLATATRERDEARAALRMIADGDLYNADGMRTIARKALAATEAARKFCGVGELEHAGYIPAGSADEREARAEVAEIEGALRASGALNQKLLDEVDRLRALTICGCGDHFAIGFEGTCPNCIAAGKEPKP